MGWMENLLEYSVKGALVIIAVVTVLVLAAPFAVGLVISTIFWDIFDEISYRFFPPKEEPVHCPSKEEILRMNEKSERKKRLERERELREIERQKVPETALDNDEEEPKKEYDLSANLHLNSKLNEEQRGRLFAQRYDLVKISPFGTSGAAHYWVNTRYNESKEHAFFCYLLEAELKKYVGKVEMNVRRGPDLVVEHKGKRYCFDVETGKSLTRQPEWLKKKFAYYQKEYDKSFILVTKRTMKYKYTKYGIVITRGKIRETLRNLFRRKACASCDKTELRNAL